MNNFLKYPSVNEGGGSGSADIAQMIHKDNLISISFLVDGYKNPIILHKATNFNGRDDNVMENVIDGDIIMTFNNNIIISLMDRNVSKTRIGLTWFENSRMRIFGINDNIYYLKVESSHIIALYFNDEKIGQFWHDT